MSTKLDSRQTVLSNIRNEISLAKRYHKRNSSILDDFIRIDQGLPEGLEAKRHKTETPIRVGYIVATCSPTTRAHIELAQQAIRNLNLDHVFFVVWPFHYIEGFHSAPLRAWIERERHIEHEHRENILRLSILDAGITASVFSETATLYRASAENFLATHHESFFWTGTWFVLRVLQRQLTTSLRISSDDVLFYFICGEDQFNPNIQSAFHGRGSEKVWKDYSIAQHLALHNIYAVPRGGLDDTLEHFEMVESQMEHQVYIGERLTHTAISATRIRSGRAEPLDAYCFPSAVAYIREKGFWGYGKRPPEKVGHMPAEVYEPLRRFVPKSAVEKGVFDNGSRGAILWADHTGDNSCDPHVILFRSDKTPHFQKYYVH